MDSIFNSFVIGHNIWWLLLAFAFGLIVGWLTCERVPQSQNNRVNR